MDLACPKRAGITSARLEPRAPDPRHRPRRGWRLRAGRVAHSLVYRLTGDRPFRSTATSSARRFRDVARRGGNGAGRRRTSVGWLRASRWRCSPGSSSASLPEPLATLYAYKPYLVRGSTIGWVAAIVAIAFAIRARSSRPSSSVRATSSRIAFPFREVGRSGFVTVGRRVVAGALVLRDRDGGRPRRTRGACCSTGRGSGAGSRRSPPTSTARRIVGIPVDASRRARVRRSPAASPRWLRSSPPRAGPSTSRRGRFSD